MAPVCSAAGWAGLDRPLLACRCGTLPGGRGLTARCLRAVAAGAVRGWRCLSGCAPILGKPAPQLMGADLPSRAEGVALTWSRRRLGDDGHRHDPGEHRPQLRFDDHHHRPAARAQDRRALLEPGQRPVCGTSF